MSTRSKLLSLVALGAITCGGTASATAEGSGGSTSTTGDSTGVGGSTNGSTGLAGDESSTGTGAALRTRLELLYSGSEELVRYTIRSDFEVDVDAVPVGYQVGDHATFGGYHYFLYSPIGPDGLVRIPIGASIERLAAPPKIIGLVPYNAFAWRLVRSTKGWVLFGPRILLCEDMAGSCKTRVGAEFAIGDCSDDGTCVAIDGYAERRSTDGGSSWELVDLSPDGPSDVDAIIAGQDGLFLATSYQDAWTSTDGGQTWAKAPGWPGEFGGSTTYGDGLFIMLKTGFGPSQAYRSTDGMTWTSSPLPPEAEVYSMTWNEQGRLFVANDVSSGGLLVCVVSPTGGSGSTCLSRVASST